MTCSCLFTWARVIGSALALPAFSGAAWCYGEHRAAGWRRRARAGAAGYGEVNGQRELEEEDALGLVVVNEWYLRRPYPICGELSPLLML